VWYAASFNRKKELYYISKVYLLYCTDYD